jgi:hypothetical protein
MKSMSEGYTFTVSALLGVSIFFRYVGDTTGFRTAKKPIFYGRFP